LKERDLPPAPGKAFRDRWKQLAARAPTRALPALPAKPPAKTTDVPAVAAPVLEAAKPQGGASPKQQARLEKKKRKRAGHG
jgi:hypothetical protein